MLNNKIVFLAKQRCQEYAKCTLHNALQVQNYWLDFHKNFIINKTWYDKYLRGSDNEDL